jgi:hypothetical protein
MAIFPVGTLRMKGSMVPPGKGHVTLAVGQTLTGQDADSGVVPAAEL